MIFVAGKNGQVARALSEAAMARGLDVKTMGRPELDLQDKVSIAAAIESENPSVIINAAAYTAVDKAEEEEALAARINANGAEALAAIAHKRNIPFIHISTDYVFDGTKTAPYVETDPVGPTGAYGRSKLKGEHAVMEANPDAIILRTAWVYSPFGGNFLKTMLSLADRDTLSVVADQFGNPTYAPDIADGILDILEKLDDQLPSPEQAGVFHMVGTGDTTWHEFATAIFEEGARLGSALPIVHAITTAEYPTPATRPVNSKLNCDKLAEVFGVSLPEWRESTAACVKRLSETDELV